MHSVCMQALATEQNKKSRGTTIAVQRAQRRLLRLCAFAQKDSFDFDCAIALVSGNRYSMQIDAVVLEIRHEKIARMDDNRWVH